MADSIVGGLFGTTPEMYQQQQNQQALSQASQMAQMSPFALAKTGIGYGANRLAGAIGGALGAVDPQLQKISAIQALGKQFDITSPEGLGMSPKRIMVSTSGVPKMIKKLADDDVKFKLAVSLHSAIDEIRSRIMPFSENFPLADLREALEYWYRKTKSKVSYEYVVWKGINDNKASVDALVKFCKYVPCKVNLIEYNPIDDGEFQQASEESINAYIKALEASGIVVKVRRSRGKDIDAACGQLANKEA